MTVDADLARHAEVEALFDALVDLPPGIRDSRLNDLSSQYSPAALAETRALLDSLARDDRLMDEPAASRIALERHFNPGDRIGAWEVDGILGRGGQGLVLKVHRHATQFRQQGVCKTLTTIGPTADGIRHLLRERQLLAELSHPGLPTVLDGGVLTDGAPYFVVELIDGERLDRWLKRVQPDTHQRVDILRRIAGILIHAHSRLILHRDIKPANVLVQDGGRVVLLDFGIAQALDTDQTDTRSGYTPGYAAPEQILNQPCGVGTDVYGLGALAYYVLAESAPFNADNTGASLHATLETELQLPPGLDLDLGAILTRALRKEAGARYLSIESMDADLARWQQRLPVEARAGNRGYIARKFISRHHSMLFAGSAALLLIVASAVVAIDQAIRSDKARQTAEEALASAETNLERAELFAEYQNAYAATLQSLFGSDSGIPEAQLNQTLNQSAAEAMALSENNPQQAAFQLFAIGRHYIYRNDYTSATAILEPWLNAAFGSDQALTDGRSLLARAYMELGRSDDAVSILRLVEAAQASGPDRYTLQHAATASQLGLSSRSDPDLANAESVILAVMTDERAHLGAAGAYLYNQLALIRGQLGRFQESLNDLRRSREIDLASGSIDPTNVDTGTLNLAEMELFVAGNLDTARSLLSHSQSVELLRKGSSANDGKALRLQGYFALHENRANEAAEYFSAALEPYARFVGENSPAYLGIECDLAEALAATHRLDEALALIESLKDKTTGTDDQFLLTRLALAEILVTDAAGNDASRLLADMESSKFAHSIARSPLLTYLRNRLASNSATRPSST